MRAAAGLMTTSSDNTATNLIPDRIVIRRVWAKMDSLGVSAHNDDGALWTLPDRSVPCVFT